MRDVVIDFETYWSRADYSLSQMTNVMYVTDTRFKAHGLSYTFDGVDIQWVSHADIPQWLIDNDIANCRAIAHNATFDCSILAWRYGVVPAAMVDTIGLAKAVIGSGLGSFSLQSVGTYLGFGGKVGAEALINSSGIRDLDPREEERMAAYAVHDSRLTWQVYKALSPKVSQAEHHVLDWTIRCAVAPTLGADANMLRQAHIDEVNRKAGIVDRLNINKAIINSRDKFAGLIKPYCERNGFPVPTKLTTSKKTGATKETWAFARTDIHFAELANHEDEELAALVSARLQTSGSLYETRTLSMANNVDCMKGWWPVGLNYSGATTTHRFSGSSVSGSAPQNLPREGIIREAIRAPKGYTIISTDLSQIELRIAAVLAGQDDLRLALDNGEDVYSSMATDIYGFVVNKVDHKNERQVGKITELSCGYGAGAGALRKMLFAQAKMVVDEDFCVQIVQTFRRRHPKYKDAWAACETALLRWAGGERAPISINLPALMVVQRNKQEVVAIRLPSGLRLKYSNVDVRMEEGSRKFTIRSEDKKKTSIDELTGERRQNIYGALLFENICQALAREVMTTKMLKLMDMGYDIALQVHDELVIRVSEADSVQHLKAISEVMNTPVDWWPGFKVVAETGCDKSYGKIKKMTHQQIKDL